MTRMVKRLSQGQCMKLTDREYWNYYKPYNPANQYFITIVHLFKIRLFHQIYK